MWRVTHPTISSATVIIVRRSGGMKIIINRCPLRYECRLQSHLYILAYRSTESSAMKDEREICISNLNSSTQHNQYNKT